jgi:hypothetical protein
MKVDGLVDRQRECRCRKAGRPHRQPALARGEIGEQKRNEDLESRHRDELFGKRNENRRQKERRVWRRLPIAEQWISRKRVAIPEREPSSGKLLPHHVVPWEEELRGVVREWVLRRDLADDSAIRIAARYFIDRYRDAIGQKTRAHECDRDREKLNRDPRLDRDLEPSEQQHQREGRNRDSGKCETRVDHDVALWQGQPASMERASGKIASTCLALPTRRSSWDVECACTAPRRGQRAGWMEPRPVDRPGGARSPILHVESRGSVAGAARHL